MGAIYRKKHSKSYILTSIESEKENLVRAFLETFEDAIKDNKKYYIYLDVDKSSIDIYDNNYYLESINSFKIYTVNPNYNNRGLVTTAEVIARLELDRVLDYYRNKPRKQYYNYLHMMQED